MEGIGNSENPDLESNGDFELNLPKDFLESSETSQHNLDQLSMDEVVETVEAMTERDKMEQKKWSNFIGNETVMGGPTVESVAGEAIDTLLKAELVQRFSDPDIVIDGEQQRNDSREFIATKLMEAHVAYPQPVAETMADVVLASGVQSATTPEQELKVTEAFKKELEAAKQQANLEDLTIAEVYSNDDSYKRMLQAVHSPQELAEPALSVHELEQSTLPNPDIIDSSAQDVKTQSIYAVIKIHGIIGLDHLPDEYKEALGVSDGGISEDVVNDAPQLPDTRQQREADVLRTAFAKSYCAKSGWDFNQLDKYQIEAIKQQPTWQNPLGIE